MKPMDSLEFAAALQEPRFTELHTRTVALPIDDVWPHCLNVAATEVRTLGPLLALRGLPTVLRRKRPPKLTAPKPLLDGFVHAGFVLLRRDETPIDGRALAILGAAGRFWSVTENAPATFDCPRAFLEFAEPGFAKTVVRLEAIALPDGRTRIETETWVAGTDDASTKKFAPYWKLIRLPSGLIRRSWLAAIDRRAGS